MRRWIPLQYSSARLYYDICILVCVSQDEVEDIGAGGGASRSKSSVDAYDFTRHRTKQGMTRRAKSVLFE